jgi:cell division transport system ATP-binding protein
MDKAVKLVEVGVYQHDGRRVLSKVSLEVAKGEFVYFVGKTGTGKTSLLKTLYGELPLTEGEGSIASISLTNLKSSVIPNLRRKIGIVFQDFQLLSDRTVNENLLFVLQATNWKSKTEMQNRADEVLAMVEMEWAADKMPHELSGGEQQRIVLARALLNKPTIIIADEPTGNLDPDTSDDIMKLIHDVAQDENTAVIMATHDYRLINKFPGTVYRTTDGALVSEKVF